ncbi:MAG: extracellular solute-binding protein [Treponema sp.]|nr:extracellular solute-binding protein [Treponema sp.]
MKNFGKTLSASALSAFFILSAFLFPSCSHKNDRTLYLYNWTYYTPEALLRKFEQEFNCKVKLDSYSTCEEMYAKIRGGAKGYDIVIPSNDFVSIMINQGMLRELDQGKLTNRDKINPVILEKLDHDPGMKYAVPYALSATGIMVNKTKVTGDYARDYSIFADPRFAGHATMMDEMREVIGCALLQKGYDMNSTDSAQLKEAGDMIINEWRPNLVKFDAESFGKSFASGDFWLCQGYPEIVYGEVPMEKWASTIDFFIPEAGGPATVDCMCILKDAPHYELANEFINFVHRPEIYAIFIDEFGYPCVTNLEAMQYVTRPAMYDAEQAYSCTLKQDLGNDIDKYSELWQKIRFAE